MTLVLRLGLNEALPDHSTFSKNRRGRFRQSDTFRIVLRRCMTEGLVRDEGFSVDASVIKADANRTRGLPASEWNSPEAPTRAVREYMAGLEAANPVGVDSPPQNSSQHLRASSRRCTYCMRHACLRAVTPPEKEGGGALCPPETHHEARSTAATGHRRSARRVLDGCSGSKSAKNGSLALADNCMSWSRAPGA